MGIVSLLDNLSWKSNRADQYTCLRRNVLYRDQVIVMATLVVRSLQGDSIELIKIDYIMLYGRSYHRVIVSFRTAL